LGLTKPKQPIYGMELAGEVEAIGRNVTKFKPGDQVFASTLVHNFGAHAEYKCLPENGVVALKPQGMRYEDATTLPIGANTALHFLKAGQIRPGQKVLVYGASGTVGTFAVQLAKIFGAEVTGVCSSRNVALVQSLGADHVIDYTSEDFTKNGQTYDIVFDAVGKTTFAQCKGSLKPNGHYLHTIMPLAGIPALWAAVTTGKKIIGGTAPSSADALALLKEFAASGQLRPVIDRCYPLEQVAEAHRYVEGGHKQGSVVVTLGHRHGS
jgi:NADPH:quinone reductase-like Zn-dependent oxidoreductase